MDSGSSSNLLFAILPFVFMSLLYLVFVAIGFVVLYYVVRAAINKSHLNQNVEQLRNEISMLNKQMQAMKGSSSKTEDHS